MHKFFRALNIAVISSIIMSTPVYAGMENHDGILRYFKDDTGTYAVNEWIDLNGSWYYFDKNRAIYSDKIAEFAPVPVGYELIEYGIIWIHLPVL